MARNEDLTQLTIELLKGKISPRYNPKEVTELVGNKVIITENGTQSDLPIIDMQMTDADGNRYFMCLTGRLYNMISSAIKGVNMRNHGVQEP